MARTASSEGDTRRLEIRCKYKAARCAASASTGGITSSLSQSGLELKSQFAENWTGMEVQPLVRHLGSWSLGKGPLQQKLARGLTQAVRNGFLIPGSRLPSERMLARALMLSRTTVVAAYDALRETGWLESR